MHRSDSKHHSLDQSDGPEWDGELVALGDTTQKNASGLGVAVEPQLDPLAAAAKAPGWALQLAVLPGAAAGSDEACGVDVLAVRAAARAA